MGRFTSAPNPIMSKSRSLRRATAAPDVCNRPVFKPVYAGADGDSRANILNHTQLRGRSVGLHSARHVGSHMLHHSLLLREGLLAYE